MVWWTGRLESRCDTSPMTHEQELSHYPPDAATTRLQQQQLFFFRLNFEVYSRFGPRFFTMTPVSIHH